MTSGKACVFKMMVGSKLSAFLVGLIFFPYRSIMSEIETMTEPSGAFFHTYPGT